MPSPQYASPPMGIQPLSALADRAMSSLIVTEPSPLTSQGEQLSTAALPSAMLTQTTNSLMATSPLALQSPAQSWANARGAPASRSTQRRQGGDSGMTHEKPPELKNEGVMRDRITPSRQIADTGTRRSATGSKNTVQVTLSPICAASIDGKHTPSEPPERPPLGAGAQLRSQSNTAPSTCVWQGVPKQLWSLSMTEVPLLASKSAASADPLVVGLVSALPFSRSSSVHGVQSGP